MNLPSVSISLEQKDFTISRGADNVAGTVVIEIANGQKHHLMTLAADDMFFPFMRTCRFCTTRVLKPIHTTLVPFSF